ncbi:hypothetical protein [Streptomyces formicae]|uniref:Membrane alanine aminopeptidase N n=1 Tax=Streptomyces formicae TaxID=1616117 RepID=A0A291QI39_9ACTN|nr:hypothetical protein [Streptomyces formicae]ATL31252.1 Membrane alanine aminopeptidase N [Streptomyces formicae]
MSNRSLPQTEAEGRAILLTVERYAVAVDLSDLMTGSRVRCESTITFTCHRPGAETVVDCAAAVESATRNGVVLRPAVEGRIALTGLGERNVLRVVSVTECSADGRGVHKAVNPSDGETYVYTGFSPDYARYVLNLLRSAGPQGAVGVHRDRSFRLAGAEQQR